MSNYLAEIWLGRLQQEGKSIDEWLTAMDEQSLLRRAQLRQLLAVVRDEDNKRFLQALSDILRSSGVRFHLQHLTLQFLGDLADPQPGEIAFVLTLLRTRNGVRRSHPRCFLGILPGFRH